MTADGSPTLCRSAPQLHQHLGSHTLAFTQELQQNVPLPTRAVMLRDGNILISDQFNDQVIEINPGKQIVFAKARSRLTGTGSTPPTTPRSSATTPA